MRYHRWPAKYETKINARNTQTVRNQEFENLNVYLSSSPPPFCPVGREIDIEAIVKVSEYPHFEV